MICSLPNYYLIFTILYVGLREAAEFHDYHCKNYQSPINVCFNTSHLDTNVTIFCCFERVVSSLIHFIDQWFVIVMEYDFDHSNTERTLSIERRHVSAVRTYHLGKSCPIL